MSCLDGWSYGIAFNNSVLQLIKSTIITRWTANHGNTWSGTYNGVPVSITFKTNPKSTSVVISSTSANTLVCSVNFTGNANNNAVSFSGTATMELSLSCLAIAQTQTNSGTDEIPQWQAKLLLEAGVFSPVTVSLQSVIPSSDANLVTSALTNGFDAGLNNLVLQSPIMLGTHSGGQSDGSTSPALLQAMGATWIQFITLNTSSSTPQVAALVMAGNQTAPTGNWQSALESAGTFNLSGQTNTVLAIADNMIWDLITTVGPTSQSGRGMSYSYGGTNPSVLTVTVKPEGDSSAAKFMEDMDWSAVVRLSMPYNEIDIVTTLYNAFTTNLEDALTFQVVQNSNGTASLEKTMTGEGANATFNPSATGPETAIGIVSGLLFTGQLSLAVLAALALIIIYTILYEALLNSDTAIANKANARFANDPQKEYGNSYYSLESFVFNYGLIVGLTVTQLPDFNGSSDVEEPQAVEA